MVPGFGGRTILGKGEECPRTEALSKIDSVHRSVVVL
jgi:hypothetical protein